MEDEKIGLFIPRCKHSRGIAQEAIARSLLVAQMLHPSIICTGRVQS